MGLFHTTTIPVPTQNPLVVKLVCRHFNYPPLFFSAIRLLYLIGEGSRATLEGLVNDIIYVNENPLPLTSQRTVVMTTTNQESGTSVVNEVGVVVKRQLSVLGIRNNCGKQEDANLLTTIGM